MEENKTIVVEDYNNEKVVRSSSTRAWRVNEYEDGMCNITCLNRVLVNLIFSYSYFFFPINYLQDNTEVGKITISR